MGSQQPLGFYCLFFCFHFCLLFVFVFVFPFVRVVGEFTLMEGEGYFMCVCGQQIIHQSLLTNVFLFLSFFYFFLYLIDRYLGLYLQHR